MDEDEPRFLKWRKRQMTNEELVIYNAINEVPEIYRFTELGENDEKAVSLVEEIHKLGYEIVKISVTPDGER